MGKEAFRFVDFLKNAGQRYWQILPICPTGYGDSPYQSFSSFAGNPYFIDLDILRQKKLLTKAEIEAAELSGDASKVDYEGQYNRRYPLLRKAYARFAENLTAEFLEFCRAEQDWLSDYALFMALKNDNGGASFDTWEDGLKFRRKAALEKAERKLAKEIGFYKFLQYEFSLQWTALKAYANQNGIRICRSMLRGTAPMCGQIRVASCWMKTSRRSWLRAVRRMLFRRTVSFGEIPSTTGSISGRTDMISGVAVFRDR